MGPLNLKRRYWLVMSCAAIFIAIALLVNARFVNARFKPSQKPAAVRFAPRIATAMFSTIPNRTNNEEMRSYRVNIFITHTGSRPAWWGKSEGVMKLNAYPGESFIHSDGLGMTQLVNPRFVSAKGKSYRWHSSSVHFNLFDAQNQQYMLLCEVDIAKDFEIENSRFITAVKTSHGGADVDTVVRMAPNGYAAIS